MPVFGLPAATVTIGSEVAFLSKVDGSARYDVTTDSWHELPPKPEQATLWTGVSLGDALVVTGDLARTEPDHGTEPLFLTYMAGDDAWREQSTPPRSNWYGPALAWTGHEMLAWGGYEVSGTFLPVNAAARYDPSDDSWQPVNEQGMPTSPGGTIVWTDPEAVAWGADPTSAARYDPVLDAWRAVLAPRGASFGSPAVAARGRVVSWTGESVAAPLVTTYDPRADSWFEAPSRCGPAPRRQPLLIWVEDGIIVWGGSVDPDAVPDADADAELERAFYLPAAALFGEVKDAAECACPAAR